MVDTARESCEAVQGLEMMHQFWIYRLADGRRVLVEADVSDRYDFMTGFGIIRTILS